MNHNPFCSINSNFYDESFRSAAPTTLNGEKVVLSQEQQRRVCDTVNTSIVGLSGNPTMLCAQKQLVPGGVLFAFPASPNQGQCPMYQPQVQTAPPAVLSSFFPSSVEYSQLSPCGCQPQKPQKTFNLQFHRDGSTSSSDLPTYFPQVPAPKGFASSTPKSCQQCQTMQQLMFPSPPTEFSSGVKNLVLCKPPCPPTSHVVDVLDADENKKVSFSPEQESATKEEGIQMTSECICDDKKCKKKPKKSESKARSRNQSHSSPTETSDDQSSQEDAKPKKKRWKKKSHKKERSSEDDGESKEKKSKGKLKKGTSNELGSGLSSEEVSIMTTSSNTSNGSNDCQCQ